MKRTGPTAIPDSRRYLIGLDYGTESARGVLLDAETGREEAHHAHPYRHGVITSRLPDGTRLPAGFALQDPEDYLQAAEAILGAIGAGREIAAIGVDFTASSPLPARADGTALAGLHPHDPHAYVKLWKHAAAQPYADAINARGGRFLDHCGGRLSGEWMLAKAAQVAAEAPALWEEAGRFIEGGDWLVWQLTGREMRSLDFAAYKAHFDHERGYPQGVTPGLDERLTPPHPVGTPAGHLSDSWRTRTGIKGEAVVAVAVIDSHAVLPAVGAVKPGVLVAALGTSAVFLLLDNKPGALPHGLEAVADNAALPGLRCYEAGQAGFGDMLSWFVRTFPRGPDTDAGFDAYNEAAAQLPPGGDGVLALDWWSGNRVPFGDSGLSGVLAGLTMGTTAAGIYRALLEAACFGARTVIDHMAAGGLEIGTVLLTSGLAHNNPLLVQLMADITGREIEVPSIRNPTAIGAAIHGAVAAGMVADYAEGARRYGGTGRVAFHPVPAHARTYDRLYDAYRRLGASEATRDVLHTLNRRPRSLGAARRRRVDRSWPLSPR